MPTLAVALVAPVLAIAFRRYVADQRAVSALVAHPLDAASTIASPERLLPDVLAFASDADGGSGQSPVASEADRATLAALKAGDEAALGDKP